MTAILKVDTIQDTSGNNIINESSDTITIGASGDTISIPSGCTITNSGTASGFGGIVNLGTTTVTGTPSEIDIDFDTSTYKQFRIFYEGIQVTADFNMYARAKVGGSIITSNNYNSATVKKYATGFDTATYGGNNQNEWYVSNNIGGDTNENWGADMLINIGTGVGMPQITINCAYKDAAGAYIANWGTLTYQNFSVINGFRIFPSTGNFDTGKYTVWGIK